MSDFEWGLLVGAAAALALWCGVRVVSPWIRAKCGGAKVTLLHIAAMRLRGCPPGLICDAYVSLVQRGVEPNLAEIESTYLANRTRIRDLGDLLELLESRT